VEVNCRWDGIVKKYIGETEKNVQQVFNAAENCGVVLFYDEEDVLSGERNGVKDRHDRYAFFVRKLRLVCDDSTELSDDFRL